LGRLNNSNRIVVEVLNENFVQWQGAVFSAVTHKKLFSYRMTLNQLRDYRWHQICATWSGFNGVVRYYLDATEILSERNPTRGELRGGEILSMGGGDYLLTEFNLWNRILSEQDIANNAMKCDGGKGNVIQWHQGFQYLTTKKKTKYNSPSVCEAPAQVAAAEAVTPPNGEGSG